MMDLLVLAVIVIAILIAKRLLWREYEPEIPGAIRGLKRVDWTADAIRFFAWLAGIALVLAAVYAVRSSPHGSWLAVAIGLGVGIALLLVSASIAARYGVTADAIDGAGLGILYVTCYAMHVRWNLVSLPVALVAVLLVTGVASYQSIRRQSFVIAILGLIGGFAAPSLLSFSDRPVVLFAYLLILNAAMSWIAYRMRWPLLIALSVARTTLYEWTWVLQSLTNSQLWLAAVIFAALAIVAAAPFLYRTWDEYPPRFRHITAVAVLLPLFFAFYMAANTNYGEQVNVLFGFLLAIAAILFVIVLRGGPAWLHVSGGMATLLTFFIWFWQWGYEWYGPGVWPPQPVRGLVLKVAVWTGLFIALYLIRVTPFAALLFFVFIGMAIRQPQDHATLIVAMLGLLLAVLVTFVRRGHATLGAIAIALSAVAVMVLNTLSPIFLLRVSHMLNPPPMPWLVLAGFTVLFAALFALASLLDVPVLAILAVPFYAAMLATSYATTAVLQLAFALAPYALFAAYAFSVRTRTRRSLLPYVAMLLASVVFFLSATVTLGQVGRQIADQIADQSAGQIVAQIAREIAGLVPLAEAAVLLALLRQISGAKPAEPRFKLIAAAALVFLNIAILMLLPKPWAVVVMALESLSLLRFFMRIAYRGLLDWSIGLAVVLFVWITFDAGIYTWVDSYGFFAYVAGFAVAICAGAMLFAAYIAPRDMPRIQLLFSLAGLIESWYLVNIIIANVYHSAGVVLNVEFMNFAPREDVTCTIAWALIATGLLFLGFHCDWQGARAGAAGLLILAVLKCFLHDLVRRGDPYRAASLAVVAVSLLAAGIILQRYASRNVYEAAG